MKSLRVCLLLLLALLVPLRGAWAVVGCSQAMSGMTQTAMVGTDHFPIEQKSDGTMPCHGQQAADFTNDAGDSGFSQTRDAPLNLEDSQGAAPLCPVCAAGCHATALLGKPASFSVPHRIALPPVERLANPWRNVHLATPERPPRTV